MLRGSADEGSGGGESWLWLLCLEFESQCAIQNLEEKLMRLHAAKKAIFLSSI